MARPVKNYCDYFPHDRDMRNHRKIKALRAKFKATGYAIWVMMLEYLTGADGNVFEYSEMELELMSGDFDVSVAEIRDVISYCLRMELLFDKDGFIHSESLDERLKPVYDKRETSKGISKKQLRNKGKFTNSNTGGDGVSATEMPQSKVNEIIDNKKEEDLVVLEMIKVWKISNYSYQFDKNLDYPACLQIAYKIARANGWRECDVIRFKEHETVESWKKIVDFAKDDPFYRNLSLIQLDKQWQGLHKKMNEPQITKPVTYGNFTSNRQGASIDKATAARQF